MVCILEDQYANIKMTNMYKREKIKVRVLNQSLHRANIAKNDEFYTQLTDIEKELRHYKEHLKNKVIFLNCDDPEESNIWKYFALNFKFLGLKKLIATHFETEKPSYKLEKSNGDTIKTRLKQNGDFRSPECIEILKESDIIITNPPFSLFREYVAQLMEYNKKFIIIGNQNAISYKEVFELIKKNKIWLGVDNGGTKWFQVPDHYDITTKSRKKIEDGKKFFSMGTIMWFTNLDIKKRHEDLILYKKYNPKDYPNYDNYKAINIDKVSDIPMDYKGVMGVPVTFLDKYNPNQFEIVGQTHSGDKSPEVESLRKDPEHRHRGIVNGEKREKYARILIKIRNFK